MLSSGRAEASGPNDLSSIPLSFGLYHFLSVSQWRVLNRVPFEGSTLTAFQKIFVVRCSLRLGKLYARRMSKKLKQRLSLSEEVQMLSSGRAEASEYLSSIPLGAVFFTLFLSVSGASLIRSLLKVQLLLPFRKNGLAVQLDTKQALCSLNEQKTITKAFFE